MKTSEEFHWKLNREYHRASTLWIMIMDRRTQIACKVVFHIRQIVLKNVIYLLVRNIHTYPPL